MIPASLRARAARAASRTLRRAGFTLIELMIAMTLLGVVMTGVIGVVVSVQKDYTRQRVRSDGITALRSGELMIGRLFRTAGADPRAIGVTGIVAQPSGTSSVRIRADFNPADGDVADLLEDVTLDLAGGEMRARFQAGGTTTALVSPVSGLTFEYFRRDGTQITNVAHADSARRVRITITSPVQKANGSASTIRSQSWAYIRND